MFSNRSQTSLLRVLLPVLFTKKASKCAPMPRSFQPNMRSIRGHDLMTYGSCSFFTQTSYYAPCYYFFIIGFTFCQLHAYNREHALGVKFALVSITNKLCFFFMLSNIWNASSGYCSWILHCYKMCARISNMWSSNTIYFIIFIILFFRRTCMVSMSLSAYTWVKGYAHVMWILAWAMHIYNWDSIGLKWCVVKLFITCLGPVQ